MLSCIKKKSCTKYSNKDNKLNNNIIEAEYIKPHNNDKSNITINLINEYLVRLKIIWDKKDKLLEVPEVMDQNNIDKRNIYINEITNLEKCILELTKLLNIVIKEQFN